jgi:integrase
MPRQSKGARLVWQHEYRDKQTGKLVYNGSWIIRDGSKIVRTGCAYEEVGRAEQRLAEYLTEKHVAPREGSKDPAHILIADVLSIYIDDKGDDIVTFKKLVGRLKRLNEWWGSKTLADINGKTCKEYVAYRMKKGATFTNGKIAQTRKCSPQGVRRELSDLRAAINYHRKQGLCGRVVEVDLPEPGKPREEFLTRSEAARLLWAAWRMREKQNGRTTRKRTGKHIARFVLIGLYTGTRHAAIVGASFKAAPDRGWVDLEKGIFHRHRDGRKETKKRQPPVRLPARLLVHLRRWHALGISKNAVVEWHGRSIESVKYGFARAVKESGIEKRVTPHTLRHTAATWLMDEGHKLWDAAGYLGMSPQILEQVYAKHHPEYQIGLVAAFKSPGVKKKAAPS